MEPGREIDVNETTLQVPCSSDPDGLGSDPCFLSAERAAVYNQRTGRGARPCRGSSTEHDNGAVHYDKKFGS
jgi:hypothetical protein